VAARELADHQGGAHRVNGELAGPCRGGHRLEGPAEPVGQGRREGVGQPPGRVVDQDAGRAELLLSGAEQQRGGCRAGQVGLDGGCPAAVSPDTGDDCRGVLRAVIPVCLRGSGIGPASRL
jgi:hypothetical protein